LERSPSSSFSSSSSSSSSVRHETLPDVSNDVTNGSKCLAKGFEFSSSFVEKLAVFEDEDDDEEEDDDE